MSKDCVVEAWQLLNKAFDEAVEYAAILESYAGFEVADNYFNRVVAAIAESRKALEKEVKK